MLSMSMIECDFVELVDDSYVTKTTIQSSSALPISILIAMYALITFDCTIDTVFP